MKKHDVILFIGIAGLICIISQLIYIDLARVDKLETRVKDLETIVEWLVEEAEFLEYYHGDASDAGAPVRGRLSTDE